MKKTPDPLDGETGALVTLAANHTVVLPSPRAAFAGSDNPRHLRALAALQTRSRTREQLDRIAGCSNGPELVAELRRRGLDVFCTRITCYDRDNRPVQCGVYHLSLRDRRKLAYWRSHRSSGPSTEAPQEAL